MARVLIVDDSRTSRRVLKDILEKNGHSVVGECVNGKEGYELYQTLKPDLVTMDITMPQMDGLDSLKFIMRYDNKAKVIMVTAAGQKEKMTEAIKVGAVEFISKPLDEQKIMEVVNKLFSE